MIIYKDVLQKLETAHYDIDRIIKEKILSPAEIENIKKNQPISLDTFCKIRKLTGSSYDDLAEFSEETT